MRGQILKILTELNKAEVRYLVVGGVAVVLHGVLRTTLDLDLVLDLDDSNVERAMDALSNLGFQPRIPVPIHAFSRAETRKS